MIRIKKNNLIGFLFIISALSFITAGYYPIFAVLGLLTALKGCMMSSKQLQEE